MPRHELPNQFLVLDCRDVESSKHNLAWFRSKQLLEDFLNDEDDPIDEDDVEFLVEPPEGDIDCLDTGKIYICRFQTVVPEVAAQKRATTWKIC